MSRCISILAFASLLALPSCQVWTDIFHTPAVVPKGSEPAPDPLLNQPVPQVQPTATTESDETRESSPELPATATEDVRLPEMLNLPSEGEFRSTNPDVKKSSTGDGPVISRPPTDPPSRPKRDETEE
jgi:hypothetical protein